MSGGPQAALGGQARDGGDVPVICPTCQTVVTGPLKNIHASGTLFLCMGLFSIF